MVALRILQLCGAVLVAANAQSYSTTTQQRIWNTAPYDVEWEGLDAAKFKVSDFEIVIPDFETRCNKKMADTPSCSKLEAIRKDSSLVTTPREFQAAIHTIKKCNREKDPRFCNYLGFRANLSLPSVQCENGYWGYDVGVNLGDYGVKWWAWNLEVDISKEEKEALIGSTMITLPLGTRSAYVYDMETYSGLPGHPNMEKPSQDARCSFASLHGSRLRITRDMFEENKDGKVQLTLGQGAVDRRFEGTTFFKGDGLENFKRRTFSKLSVGSWNYYNPSMSQIPTIPLFAKDASSPGIRFKKLYPNFAQTSSCPYRCNECAWAKPAVENLPESRDYSRAFNAIGECTEQNQLEGHRKCEPYFELGMIIQMKTYGSKEKYLGFDLGVSLGDYGLELQSNTFYLYSTVGTPKVRSVKTINLAPYTPKLDDFGYIKTTEKQRIALALAQEEMPTKNMGGEYNIGGTMYMPFKPTVNKPVHGTTLISVSNIEELTGENMVYMTVVKSKKIRRTEIPDLRNFNAEIP